MVGQCRPNPGIWSLQNMVDFTRESCEKPPSFCSFAHHDQHSLGILFLLHHGSGPFCFSKRSVGSLEDESSVSPKNGKLPIAHFREEVEKNVWANSTTIREVTFYWK